MIRVAVICLTVLAACGYSRAADGRVVVEDDRGGPITEYEQKRAMLAYHPAGIILCGNIGSAATIFVSLPNACACPDALFHFHGARVGIHHSPEGTAVMASYYPEPLRDWYLREAAHLILTDYATLTARELAAMNVLEVC